MKTNPLSHARTALGASLVAVTLAASPAHADTLQEETLAVIETSPTLASERARLQATRQALPLAWSEILPQMTVDGSSVDTRRTEKRVALTIRERPEYWIATARISTMLFGSGRVWASTRQARSQIATAIAQYQNAAQDLIVDLSRAYGEVRFARASLAAQEQSLANLQEQSRFAQANLREGFLTRTDVAQADARVALARGDLARARSRVVQASEAYMRITGHPPGVLEAPPALEGLPADLDAGLAAAEDHPAVLAAAANVRAADAAVDVAAANGRLRVFLESNTSRYDVVEGGTRFHEQEEDNLNVRVTVPIFAGGSVRARTRQQRYLREAATYDMTDVQRRVRERLTDAWSELDSTRVRLEASHARLEAAELAQRGVRREQQFGQRSMIDVLNQEQELLSARVAVAEAERDAMIAERVYASAAGQLAALLGVAVETSARR